MDRSPQLQKISMLFRPPMCSRPVFIHFIKRAVCSPLIIHDATPLKSCKDYSVHFYLLFIFCMCTCVWCVCMCVYAYSHICVCTCMWNAEVNIQCLNCSSCYLWRQGLLLNLQLSNSSCHQPICSSNPLSSPLKCQDYKGSNTLVWNLLRCSGTQDCVETTSFSKTSPQPQKNIDLQDLFLLLLFL